MPAALGALPDRIAVGGDSAGGNLAAVVAQKAKAAGGPAPCAQMLLYPALDRTVERPSLELFRDGFLIGRADIAWYHLHYTGSAVAQPDPAQNPLLAKDLAGLAPALIVTAGFDPLRDEGEAYADALRQAGVPVVLQALRRAAARLLQHGDDQPRPATPPRRDHRPLNPMQARRWRFLDTSDRWAFLP